MYMSTALMLMRLQTLHCPDGMQIHARYARYANTCKADKKVILLLKFGPLLLPELCFIQEGWLLWEIVFLQESCQDKSNLYFHKNHAHSEYICRLLSGTHHMSAG